MSTVVGTHREEVDALTTELVGLEALNDRHQAAASEAARKHRAGTLGADELQAATSAAAAVAYAFEQTRSDLANARAALAEAESAAADELLLAEIAAGTVEHQEAEAAHWQLLEDTQQVVARAIVRSQELMKASAAATGRAGQAAYKLAERHGTTPTDGRYPLAEYARAVVGTDVKPLTGQEQVLRWPGHGNFRLLKAVPNSLMGVSIRPSEGA